MGIIGGVAGVRVIRTDQVEYILPTGDGRCEIKLRAGAAFEHWPYANRSASFEYSKEKTGGGDLWTCKVNGEISPVSPEKESFVDRYAGRDFIVLVDLHSGGTKVMGSLAISCTVEESGEVTAGIEKNAMAIDLVYVSPQRALGLKAVL